MIQKRFQYINHRVHATEAVESDLSHIARTLFVHAQHLSPTPALRSLNAPYIYICLAHQTTHRPQIEDKSSPCIAPQATPAPLYAQPLKLHLLLALLCLQVLVDTEGDGSAEEDNGVEGDAAAGTVRGDRGVGLRVRLGLGVALLGDC